MTTVSNAIPASSPSISNVQDAMPSMIAMINTLISMEGAIANVLGKNAQLEINVQDANVAAVKAAGEDVLKKVEAAQEAADSSSGWGLFGEIFGWVAAALTAVLSFGTLSVVAAIAVSATTVAMQAGAFNQGPLGDLMDKISGGEEWAKDLISLGVGFGVSIGAGAASEAMAAGVNALKSSAVDAASVGTEMSGQFGVVSKTVLSQALMVYLPNIIQDTLNQIPNMPQELSTILAFGLSIALSCYVSYKVVQSPEFTKAGPNGIAAAVVNKVRSYALGADVVSTLASTGFNLAKGVYTIKRGLLVKDEAEPMAKQEFMKDFMNLFSQQVNRSTQATSQTMQNDQAINEHFSQLTAPLDAAAQVLASF